MGKGTAGDRLLQSLASFFLGLSNLKYLLFATKESVPVQNHFKVVNCSKGLPGIFQIESFYLHFFVFRP